MEKPISNRFGFLGIKTATFEIIGDGKQTIKLDAIHGQMKDKCVLGLSIPSGLTTSPSGLTTYEARTGLYLDLEDSNQVPLNQNLPVDEIHKYCQSNIRFYPIANTAYFDYSQLKFATAALATAANGKAILITVHYQD